MIEILWPWATIALPLPLLIRLVLPASKNSGHLSAAIKVPFFDFVASSRDENKKPSYKFNFKLFTALLIWLLVIISAINPVWIGEPVQLPTEGRNLMLAIDVSPSMQEKDLSLGNQAVDRLTVLKNIISDFIDRRQGDRLGLILFGSKAYLQTPLSFDRKTVNILLDESQIGMAGKATAIGDAIGMGLKKLMESASKEKVLILATDGANTAGEIDPLKAAELASLEGLTIYTIGIGADSMELPGLFGSAFGSRTVNPSRDLDEKMLMEIANITGGQYFRAKSSEDLRDIYKQLDKLEPVKGEAETYRPRKKLFHFPLGLAFVISLILAVSHLLPGNVKNTFGNELEEN